MSAAIGASAAGARAYTATASQGLLYMVEALYNASGLGLPIVMTVANRAIGAPINIWNDHSDSMSQRDSGWIQLYAESNQEALDLHIQAFKLAEELSLPVMVCMDGFILTHAYERGRRAGAGAGRLLPAAVRAQAGPRPRGPGDDRRDGRPGGVLRGEVPDARKADAGARRHPADRRRVRERVRARVRRAGPDLPGRGRRDDRGRAWLRPRHDRGRGRRAARAGSEDRGRGDQVLPALPAGGGTGGASARGADRGAREGVRRRGRRHRGPEREAGSLGPSARRSTTSSPGSAAVRSPSSRSMGCSPTCSRTGSRRAGCTSSTSTRDRVERELERMREGGRTGPHAENILRDIGVVAARSH